MKKKHGITAAELMAELQSDPEFQRRQSERDRVRQERQRECDEQIAPYLKQLSKRGFHGQSLQEIVRLYCPLPDSAINVLLPALGGLSEPRLLESVVRALGAAAEPFDGRPLVRCFESTDDEGLKWAIANTIALVRPHSIDEWLSQVCKIPYWNKTLRGLGLKNQE